MARSDESSAKDLISRFIESIGIHDEQGIVPFIRSWPRIVGTDSAAHSTVLDLKNGALLVGVDHPAWLQRIHFSREQIVAKIKREFPELGVRYLHLTVVDHLETPKTDIGENPTERNESDDTTSPREESEVPTGPPADDSEIQRADDDNELQKHLKGLREALERKHAD